ncbi:hypothetical protein [Chromobacterium sphagni]|uniref:Uncharacterized protein n=1 Tax=Chromobacterium sphagni TaxID=1903179 RepID=A0A1S1WTX7_9NEIS|nr:hypothetical protein [Chromobacterium sphagni]OHX10678.1 hypothetical protein BI347_19335 [Chromobacterium sphagni]OHX19432.1 hypothetical protein BI344_18475 [Chromobacterium sphagni]
MTATPVGVLLLLIVLLFFLHASWRLIASKSGSAIGCFLAAYIVLAALLNCHPEPVSLTPLLLPFIYAYAWLGIAAAMWAAVTMRVTRKALLFPGQDPRLAALFSSQLALHIGVLALSPWLDWRPLAVYIMAPPLIASVSYFAYRAQLLAMRRREVCGTSWAAWGMMCLLLPLLLVWLAQWLTPAILGLT